MRATESNLLKLLQGTKQFSIPIYQRTYSWTTKQCQQLWNDIIRLIRDEKIPGHFIGSIVYIEQGIYQASAVSQLLVIDGQQRLTTLSLLLTAIGKAMDAAKTEAEITRKKINSYYLFNMEESRELKYKLKLTQSDHDTFIRMIEDREQPIGASQPIVDNYGFFEKQIRESGIDPQILFKAVGKLIIVDVSLDRDHDNPQLIFESLNSTGLDLSQADLIRNFVLMGLKPAEQNDLYTNYWYPMEQSFGHTEYAELFDRFMRDYLTVKSPSGTIPNIKEVYGDFKEYVRTCGKTIHDIVAEINRFSKHFVKLSLDKESDQDIRYILTDINTLKVDVAYPFLLEVFDDYEQKKITRDDVISMLRMVESYVLRRVIAGVPTNSLNKTFATLTRSIDKTRYLENIQASFLLKDSYRRFPDDDEFKREFVVKNIYDLRNRNYILRKLENHDRKETVEVEDYTIEHVLPQNPDLSAQWQTELGTDWKNIQSKYLHTIGNLTLTGYNPELSDRPFLEKRVMKGGFADSPIRLNHSLAKLEHWNESEIQKRAASIAELAPVIWPIPKLSDEILAKYRKQEAGQDGKVYTIEDYSDRLGGETVDLFNILRKRILNLDSSVKEEFKKLYIAYKSITNFVDVVPQKHRLRLSLNMPFVEINDPKGLCKDITGVGRWGNGDVEVGFSSPDQIEDIMFLIEQAFNKQRENGND